MFVIALLMEFIVIQSMLRNDPEDRLMNEMFFYEPKIMMKIAKIFLISNFEEVSKKLINNGIS